MCLIVCFGVGWLWCVKLFQGVVDEARTAGKKIKGQKKGSILFAHGVCHDAWCWHNYLEYFSALGYDCYALSLRGHGQSEGREHLDQWGLSDYTTDVVEVIKSIGEKPLVVGHSMGGAITQKLIGEHESIIRAAVLLAPAVKDGLNLAWKFKRFKGSVWKALQFLRMLHHSGVDEKTLKNSLFLNNRLSSAEVMKLKPHIQVESRRAANDLSAPYTPNYGRANIPVMVIGSADDLLFPTEDLLKTATAYQIKPVILTGMCHDMMIDPDWKRGAVRIESFLGKSA